MFNFLLKGSDQSPAAEVSATASAAATSALDGHSALTPEEVIKFNQNAVSECDIRHEKCCYLALTALTALCYHLHSNYL